LGVPNGVAIARASVCATLSRAFELGDRRVGNRHESGAEFQATGIAERLGVYETSHVPFFDPDDSADEELVERAATLLSVMPRNQLRATIEQLLSPDDLERGRRAVDALIDTAFAIEDETGHLRRAG
jgi:hypothetical protein